MKFEHENCGNFVVIRPEAQRLDSLAAPEFRQLVLDISEEFKKPLVVDLVNVEFMDSSGLGAVIGCYKATQTTGGLALCNVHDAVKEVFTLTHMDRIFEIDDDYDSCVDKQAA